MFSPSLPSWHGGCVYNQNYLSVERKEKKWERKKEKRSGRGCKMTFMRVPQWKVSIDKFLILCRQRGFWQEHEWRPHSEWIQEVGMGVNGEKALSQILLIFWSLFSAQNDGASVTRRNPLRCDLCESTENLPINTFRCSTRMNVILSLLSLHVEGSSDCYKSSEGRREQLGVLPTLVTLLPSGTPPLLIFLSLCWFFLSPLFRPLESKMDRYSKSFQNFRPFLD